MKKYILLLLVFYATQVHANEQERSEKQSAAETAQMAEVNALKKQADDMKKQNEALQNELTQRVNQRDHADYAVDMLKKKEAELQQELQKKEAELQQLKQERELEQQAKDQALDEQEWALGLAQETEIQRELKKKETELQQELQKKEAELQQLKQALEQQEKERQKGLAWWKKAALLPGGLALKAIWDHAGADGQARSFSGNNVNTLDLNTLDLSAFNSTNSGTRTDFPHAAVDFPHAGGSLSQNPNAQVNNDMSLHQYIDQTYGLDPLFFT